MKLGIGLIIAIIVVGGGWYLYTNQPANPTAEALPKGGGSMEKDGEVMEKKSDDAMMKEDDGAMMEDDTHGGEVMMKEDGFDYNGTLDDVSGGSAAGDAKARFKDGAYELVATFEGLPDPQGTDFYEGWVVRRGANMSVVSTGRVEEEAVGYLNLYMSSDDLTDHDFYVLTLEPDDGDPAPAAHILEGVLTKS